MTPSLPFLYIPTFQNNSIIHHYHDKVYCNDRCIFPAARGELVNKQESERVID